MEIIPALLVPTIQDLTDQVTNLRPYYHHFQIDIVDGVYLPNTTVSTTEIYNYVQTGKTVLNDPEIIIDFDLMVADYKLAAEHITNINRYVSVGSILFHFDSLKKSPLPGIKNITTGIALAPHNTVEDLDRYYDINTIKSIQIMTVRPGFQGSPFEEDSLYKIEQLRTSGYKSKIFIDGSVNNKTIPDIMSRPYRPDFLCVGSYLSRAEDIRLRVKELQEMIAD